jgi:hypothetical protein
VTHVEWMVDALHKSHELTEDARLDEYDEWWWRETARYYESSLLGAQILSVWMSWLDYAKALYSGTTYNSELIIMHLGRTWDDMTPVLEQLETSRMPMNQRAARTMQSKLPEWSAALSAWATESEEVLREGEELLQTLLYIQAGFELVSMGQMAGSLGGGARVSYVFMLPGIGGVSASGAIAGVRVVVNAEWIAAIRHLAAIGAISTVEIVKLAGVSTNVAGPIPSPDRPVILRRQDQAGGTGAERPSRVLVQHSAGNRQVEVGGQRWHVPKGKGAHDIPATDPVGDRLQKAVDDIARGWSPAKLSGPEQDAIDKARAAGKPWRAKLLERQARGRWVERKAEAKFPELTWSRRSVDAVDPGTGIAYEVLSGTRENLDRHAKRMANELFRMITF